MHREPWSRRIPLIITPALVAAAYLGLPQADAAAAEPGVDGFNAGGASFTIAPAALVLSDHHDFVGMDPSYGWGFGAGYMFAPGGLFKGSIGGTFEHNVLFLDDYRFGDFGAHTIRAMPELRLGIGNNRAWAYGLMGAGLGATFWKWNSSVPGFDGTSGKDMATGLSLQVGAGVQALVSRRFFIGGEVDLDAGFVRETNPDDWRLNDDDNFSMYQVSFEFIIGWKF